MGVITTSTQIDDYTGLPEEDIREVAFSLEGRTYKLDACTNTRALIRTALAPFIAVAREEVDGFGIPPALVREWARSVGITVASTGRIPVKVFEMYLEAHE